jgi:hypothetical protein
MTFRLEGSHSQRIKCGRIPFTFIPIFWILDQKLYMNWMMILMDINCLEGKVAWLISFWTCLMLPSLNLQPMNLSLHNVESRTYVQYEP